MPPIFQSSRDLAVIERARKYVARMPPAVSGQSGHNATFHVACVLALGFGLGEGEALALLREHSETCQPPQVPCTTEMSHFRPPTASATSFSRSTLSLFLGVMIAQWRRS